MQVKVSIDKMGEIARISEKVDKALNLYQDEMVDDVNKFVPIGGGDAQNGGGGSLRRSAELNATLGESAKNGELTLRWDTPYAHYQHEGLVMHGPVGNRTYGPKKLNYTSTTARAEWTKHAEKVYADNWAKAIQKLMERV